MKIIKYKVYATMDSFAILALLDDGTTTMQEYNVESGELYDETKSASEAEGLALWDKTH